MTTQLQGISLDQLYHQDFCLWLETTVRLLRERELNQLDFENLIEEIESMGNEQKYQLESNLIVVLMHLLKYKYQPEKRSNSWRYTLIEYRRRLRKAFQSSPSLKPYFEQVFDECYQDAKLEAAAESGLPLDTFPMQSPFTDEETLNPDYLPE